MDGKAVLSFVFMEGLIYSSGSAPCFKIFFRKKNCNMYLLRLSLQSSRDKQESLISGSFLTIVMIYMDLVREMKNFQNMYSCPSTRSSVSTRGNQWREVKDAGEAARGLWAGRLGLALYLVTSVSEVVVLVSNVMWNGSLDHLWLLNYQVFCFSQKAYSYLRPIFLCDSGLSWVEWTVLYKYRVAAPQDWF